MLTVPRAWVAGGESEQGIIPTMLEAPNLISFPYGDDSAAPIKPEPTGKQRIPVLV
jgi:hypothetical protein